MRIQSMRASFGQLENRQLDLAPGLNILESPNEGGKSTWCAFLRTMLYGIDTRERNHRDALADKNHYEPWSGAPMEGSLSLEWQGKQITVRRSGRTGAPFSRFQAVYTGTEDQVPDLTGETAGELLTGVGRSAFERTAFIGQDAVTVTNSAELEQRIHALVSDGQEEVGCHQAVHRLKQWKNRRQSGSGAGLIPKLEQQRDTCQVTLEKMNEKNQELKQLHGRIYQLEQQYEQRKQQVNQEYTAQAEEQKQRLCQAEQDVETARKELDRCTELLEKLESVPDPEKLWDLKKKIAEFDNLEIQIWNSDKEPEANPEEQEPIPAAFQNLTPEQARAQARQDTETLQTYQKYTNRMLLSILLLFVMVAAGITLFFFHLIWFILIPGVLAVCALVFWILFHRKMHGCAPRVREIADLYETASEEKILQLAEEYCARTEQSAGREASVRRLNEQQKQIREHLIASAKAFAPEISDLFGAKAAVSKILTLMDNQRKAKEQLDRAQAVWEAMPHQTSLEIQEVRTPELVQLQQDLEQARHSAAQLQGELQALGDYAAEEARLALTEQQLEQRNLEYQALTLAGEALEEAGKNLNQRLSPVLNQRAGELLSRLTEGRYNRVTISQQFEAKAAGPEDVNPRELLFLSQGAWDQTYLAIRLALCEEILPEPDPAPINLDDALVHYDDRRIGLALDLLAELAGKRQILLFTCQSRERQVLSGRENVSIQVLS